MGERIQEMKEYGMEKAVRRNKRYKSDIENRSDWDDYYDKGFEESHVFFRDLDKFLLSNINRPYKNVYADFCKKWPARIGKYIDTRATFRKICGVEYISSGCNFIVDEKGILKKNMKSRRFKKKEKRKIVVGRLNDMKTYEIFNKTLLKYPKIVNFFNEVVGRKNVADIIENDKLSNNVSKILHHNSSRINTFLCDKKGYIRNGSWVYKKITENTDIVAVEGTPEYTKAIYETKQAKKASDKREKKIKESMIASLLHDLRRAAKRIEEEKNIIDRDRLGFGEDSFIGVPYHGQKRKKK